MSMCQKQNNPPYFELTASPLSAEILWVSELLPGLLETREAVQLHLELASGPQPVSDTVIWHSKHHHSSPGWRRTDVPFLQHSLDFVICPRSLIHEFHDNLIQLLPCFFTFHFESESPLLKRLLFEMPSSSHYVPCLFDIYIWKKAHVSSKIRQQLSLHRKNLITLLLQSRHLYVQFMVNFAYFSGPSLASFV